MCIMSSNGDITITCIKEGMVLISDDPVRICSKGGNFEPFGGPMIPGNDDTIMCAKCGLFKRGHPIKK